MFFWLVLCSLTYCTVHGFFSNAFCIFFRGSSYLVMISQDSVARFIYMDTWRYTIIGHLLHLIISQVTTPICNFAEKMKRIIINRMILRTLLRSHYDQPVNLSIFSVVVAPLASLDVESLFTNVPVEPTIGIILNSVYSHPSRLAPHTVFLELYQKACYVLAPVNPHSAAQTVCYCSRWRMLL